MPWKECSVTQERLRFVARLLDGEDKPHWGARKIRELLVRKLAGDVRLPARSTVHAVLDRHGLVNRARIRRNRANGTPLSAGANPNDACGAPTSRASSSSAMAATVTP